MAYIEVTDVFENIQEVRNKLKLHSLMSGCAYYLNRSKPGRLDAVCPSVSQERAQICNFRLTAYRKADGYVRIKQCILEHSPFCPAMRMASGWAIKQKVQLYVANFKTVRPRDVQNMLLFDHNTTSHYQTVWNGLQKARKEEILENDKSFQLLAGYFRNIITTLELSLHWSAMWMDLSKEHLCVLRQHK